MSKKSSKKVSKPLKKSAAKPAKKSGKAKPVAALKKSAKKAAKPAPKKAVKAAKKSPAKKVVKKNVVKKAAKPLKKALVKKSNKPAAKARPLTKGAKAPAKKTVAKKSAAKKIVKPAPKKTLKPAPKKLIKTPAKPVKPAQKAAGKQTPLKTSKIPQKPVKPAAPVKPVKTAEKGKTEKSQNAAAEPIISPKVKPLKPRGKGGRKPKNKNDDDEPEIVHDELIEQIIQTTRRQAKQPKGPKIIKTFVNPHESLAAALPPENGKKGSIPKKEPKGKFELEYVVRTSASILYEFLTTPSGLSEWFADDVNIRDGVFTFYWDGSEQKARLLAFKEEKFLRLRWLDKPEGYYFEFRIERDELTGDVSLIIVDFADEASDMQTSKLLWDSQVGKLLNVLGSN